MEKKFYISGMSCSHCKSVVENGIKELNGVEKVEVDLLSNSMIVDYDNNKLRDKDIVNEVSNLGYLASTDENNIENAEHKYKGCCS